MFMLLLLEITIIIISFFRIPKIRIFGYTGLLIQSIFIFAILFWLTLNMDSSIQANLIIFTIMLLCEIYNVIFTILALIFNCRSNNIIIKDLTNEKNPIDIIKNGLENFDKTNIIYDGESQTYKLYLTDYKIYK